jgi:peptidoglycan/xylan/chitin deacetylase (PgdA/CDA1 family)
MQHALPKVRLAVLFAAALLATACGTATTPGAITNTPSPAPTTTGRTGPQPSTPPSTTTPPTTTPSVGTIPVGLMGQDITAIPTTQKVVALTFDAGANADGLASILSTLSSRHVTATFFLTGQWAARYPSSAKVLVAGGYRLGNHTDTHPYLTKLTDSAITSQLVTARSKILAAGGTDPRPLFRFPYGDRNSHTISVVNRAGYIAVRWTVDSLGWKGTSGGQSTATVVNRVVAAARPGEIVLMHVGSNPDDHTTLDANALPTVIERLEGLGYRFVTLDAALSAGGTVPSGCDPLAWHSAPLTVSHTPAVPPVPSVTGIRTGSHSTCRYDRIVFDITGSIPGYNVRYVSRVNADPSDLPVTVPGGGSAYLLITLHPAQSHDNRGITTIAARSAALGYPMLKGYALAGDFEGYVTIALGLSATTVIRVGELSGRVYLDVSY